MCTKLSQTITLSLAVPFEQLSDEGANKQTKNKEIRNEIKSSVV